MPELPEVETVKNSLKELVLNKKIKDVLVFYDKIIKNVTKEEFIEKIKNQKITNIDRIGKHLIFVLDDYYLISHLRMEGKYYTSNESNFNKHEHIVFCFNDFNLRYQDTRKFGTMYLYDKLVDIYKEKPLNNVGLEPFDDKMTVQYLKNSFKNSIRPIKSSLLDQSVIAGLGNIYVDEVLFMSKIDPQRKTCSINDVEYANIISSSKIVLNKAIKLGGTTIKSFTVNHDISGRFQNELLVHTKKVCPVCNKDILKIRVGGRGTYFCSTCQK